MSCISMYLRYLHHTIRIWISLIFSRKIATPINPLKIINSNLIDRWLRVWAVERTCTEEAAPPPTPIRYTGPPIFTTSIPGREERPFCYTPISYQFISMEIDCLRRRHAPVSAASFLMCVSSMAPRPPLNIMGLIHSLRSPLARRMPNERAKPAQTETERGRDRERKRQKGRDRETRERNRERQREGETERGRDRKGGTERQERGTERDREREPETEKQEEQRDRRNRDREGEKGT